MTEPITQLNSHYGTENLSEKILRALAATGVDIDNLKREDIAAFDEFHVGGLKETRILAKTVGLEQGMHVLDVGSGIGGPARTLASEFGCRVTGLDATHEYCRAAEMLTARVGLNEQVDFVEGSATEMPFKNSTFDAVWFQHVGMNIEDKEHLYAEIRRVLRPGGRFIFHEILEGNGKPLDFPVPWAPEAELSHLAAPKYLQQKMQELQFVQEYWEDITARAIAWLKEREEKIKQHGLPPISIGALLGRDPREYTANLFRNLTEERAIIVQADFRRQ